MTNMMIRKSQESDIKKLIELQNLVLDNSNTPGLKYWESVEEYANHCPPGSQIVAVIQNNVTGYLGFHPPTKLKSNSHVLEIDIGVHHDYQRMGVGRELVNYITTWAQKNEYRKLSLRVLSSNPVAITFYESNGFKVQGSLKDEFFIDGHFVDDILMYKML